MPKPNFRPSVWWSILSERAGAANDQCYISHLQVAMSAGQHGYSPILMGYARTDYARNELCKNFLQVSKRDDDLLIMLDGDHKHPGNILEKFAAEDPKLGVVGALAFRRGEPYDPLFFIRSEEGSLGSPLDFEMGPVYRCAIVSTSAISIRRWALLELEQAGYTWPYFRYEYPTNLALPSEDMYFGRICEQAGIWHHVDTSIVIPHAGIAWVDQEVRAAFLHAHPAQGKIEMVKA